jgi:hypothetical protein
MFLEKSREAGIRQELDAAECRDPKVVTILCMAITQSLGGTKRHSRQSKCKNLN